MRVNTVRTDISLSSRIATGRKGKKMLSIFSVQADDGLPLSLLFTPGVVVYHSVVVSHVQNKPRGSSARRNIALLFQTAFPADSKKGFGGKGCSGETPVATESGAKSMKSFAVHCI